MRMRHFWADVAPWTLNRMLLRPPRALQRPSLSEALDAERGRGQRLANRRAIKKDGAVVAIVTIESCSRWHLPNAAGR